MRDSVEEGTIGESQIIRRRKGHHPPNVDRGSGAKEKAVGVHQEEIGGWEPAWPVGLNHAKDTGRSAPVDAAQDVGGR